MQSSINKRIKDFIFFSKMSVSEFAQKLNYSSPEKLNRLFRSDKNKPSIDIICDIANKFVELNIEWLITGRGNMIRPPGEKTEGNIVNEPQVIYKTVRDIETENTLLKQENKFLNKEIEYLKNEISLKDKIIKLLENK